MMPSYTNEDLILIKQLHVEKNFGAKKIMAMFPSKPWTRSGVEYTIRKINQTGSIARRAGSGRPREARSDANINQVKELILSQQDKPGPRLTPNKIQSQLGISRTSIRRIIKEDLKQKKSTNTPKKKIKKTKVHKRPPVHSQNSITTQTEDILCSTAVACSSWNCHQTSIDPIQIAAPPCTTEGLEVWKPVFAGITEDVDLQGGIWGQEQQKMSWNNGC